MEMANADVFQGLWGKQFKLFKVENSNNEEKDGDEDDGGGGGGDGREGVLTIS